MVLLGRYSEQKPNFRSNCGLLWSSQILQLYSTFHPRLWLHLHQAQDLHLADPTQPQIILFCGQQVCQKDSQLCALLKGMKPLLKGFVAVSKVAASPSCGSSRELLPACWPELPQAGWSCSGLADEAAVSPQAVGHDRPSPRHRPATALWASTCSSMSAEIHCPRLEEKTAAQDSPSKSTALLSEVQTAGPGPKTQGIWITKTSKYLSYGTWDWKQLYFPQSGPMKAYVYALGEKKIFPFYSYFERILCSVSLQLLSALLILDLKQVRE